MKRNPSRWFSLTAMTTMTGLFASPLLAAGVGDPNGPGPYQSLPLVVPSAPAYVATVPAQPIIEQQQPAPAPAQEQDKFTAAQLKEMVSAIALYPDPLIAQILAGATFPLDIVQASRFIKANANDPALRDRIAEQSWDPSVQALAYYPSVLAMMDENLAWTQDLGAAFFYQQEDVMAAIQDCRLQAQTAGNLATTQEQRVVVEERIIYIYPADPQVIYVPVYEPEIVYVQRRPDYFGHAISFGIGFSVGSWLDLDCNWHDHHVYRGGWYNSRNDHRDHRDHRDVNVHVHKQVNNNVIVHRDAPARHDDHRDDDHRDDNRFDSRSRTENVWKRDVSKPVPQVRSQGESGRVNVNVPKHSDAGNRVVVGERGDDRGDARGGERLSDRAVDRTGDRPIVQGGKNRPEVGPTVNRSTNGYVRQTPSYVRPVTPSVSPSVTPSGTPSGTLSGTRSVPQLPDNRMVAPVDRGGLGDREARSDRDDRRVESRPLPGNSDSSKRSADGANDRPKVSPRVAPVPSTPPAPPVPVVPEVRSTPAPRTPSPVVPEVRSAPAPRTPVPAPVPAPRIEQSTQPTQVDRSRSDARPDLRPDPRMDRAPSASDVKRSRDESPRYTPSPSSSSSRDVPSRAPVATPASPSKASARATPSAPAPRPSIESSKPSSSRESIRESAPKPLIASERAAGNAAAREKASSTSKRSGTRDK